MAKRGSRVALALATLFLCLLALEGALRLWFPALPSLSPLQEPGAMVQPDERRPSSRPSSPEAWSNLCQVENEFNVRPPRWSRRIGDPQAADPLHVLAVGDSLMLGAGVEPEESFAWLLAAQLAERRERSVQVDNIAVNGGHYCEYLRELHGWLNREPLDLVLLGFFVDDLEARGMLLMGEDLVVFPDQVENRLLRGVVSNSWLANEIWRVFKGRVGHGPVRFIDAQGQAHFRSAVAAAGEHMKAVGVPWLAVLLAPVGTPLCAERPELANDCGWLTDDGRLMARLLRETGMEFADLRAFWDQHRGHLQDLEVREMDARHRLPIHPDAGGHQLLADALVDLL